MAKDKHRNFAQSESQDFLQQKEQHLSPKVFCLEAIVVLDMPLS
jgi:hypothetical protein